ncbi:MAG: hypothetical protein ABSE53_01205 [Terracidiphilus sp.]
MTRLTKSLEADFGFFVGRLAGAGLDRKGRPRMQDAVMLLFTVVFFAVAFLYVKACQKLR